MNILWIQSGKIVDADQNSLRIYLTDLLRCLVTSPVYASLDKWPRYERQSVRCLLTIGGTLFNLGVVQMPEAGGSNIEVAHHLSEHKATPDSLSHELLEIAEAIVLAVVAIATAWSGYQAALWTGHQGELYGEASKLRIQAEGTATAANQERLYNASTVVEWLKAQAQGDKKLADLFERRMLPEFRPAFEAWKRTDPLHNQDAPAGPSLMPQYRNSKTEEASKLNEEATNVFEQGNNARHHSDEYVRVTVTLATVLLLMAISQRFKTSSVRIGLAVVAMLLLCFPVFRILTLPRA